MTYTVGHTSSMANTDPRFPNWTEALEHARRLNARDVAAGVVQPVGVWDERGACVAAVWSEQIWRAK